MKKSFEKIKPFWPAVVLLMIAIIMGLTYFSFAAKVSDGTKTLQISVIDDESKQIDYTVCTDAQYLREALEEVDGLTISGEESAEYGLLVKTVNGLTAGADADGAYWAFYQNDAYCNYGVDKQPVADGEHYKIVYEIWK